VTQGAREHGRGGEGGLSTRTASWIAWAGCALSLALTALSFLLIALILSLNAPIYFYWLEPTTIAVGYSVIGAIVASRLPRHPIGWICCAIGFMGAVTTFCGEYAGYALLAHPEPLLGGKVMLWLGLWVWILMFGFIEFLLFLFPTGRLPSTRWRPLAWLSAALTLMAAMLMAISPNAVLDTLGPSGMERISFPSPLGVEGLPNLYLPVQTLVLLLGGVAAASVVVGRRGARGVERQQIKWLLYAGAIFFVGNVLKNCVLSPRRSIVGLVGWLFACRYWWFGRSYSHRPSDPALQALRHRSPHQSHTGIRFIDSHTNSPLLRWHRGVAEGVRLTHGPEVHPGSRGLHPPDSGAVYALEAAYPILHRQALLPQEVRCQEDPRSLLHQTQG
jgi:hypothetical protein